MDMTGIAVGESPQVDNRVHFYLTISKGRSFIGCIVLNKCIALAVRIKIKTLA